MSDKARMRALRETVGLTQPDLAEMVGVRPLTVKRWEREDNPWEPPEDVIAQLERLLAVQAEAVEAAMGVVSGLPDGGSVQLRYYRDQAMYDEHGRDEGPVGVANATARAVAAKLRGLGYEVGYSYPGEGAAADAAAAAPSEDR